MKTYFGPQVVVLVFVFPTSSTALSRPPPHPSTSAVVGQAVESLLVEWLFSALYSRHYPCLPVFNCSEKLAYWLSACLKRKCDGLSVGMSLGPSV